MCSSHTEEHVCIEPELSGKGNARVYDMQVIRTKHKLKAFAFAAKAPKGCAASLTLALGNNTLEVCSHHRLPGPACQFCHGPPPPAEPQLHKYGRGMA